MEGPVQVQTLACPRGAAHNDAEDQHEHVAGMATHGTVLIAADEQMEAMQREAGSKDGSEGRAGSASEHAAGMHGCRRGSAVWFS